MYIFFLERYPHGIFAAGGALVPAQEKEKKKKEAAALNYLSINVNKKGKHFFTPYLQYYQFEQGG